MTDTPDTPSPVQDSPSPPRRKHRFNLMIRLRNYFIAGILVTAPVSITMFIAWKFINFVDNQFAPLIPYIPPEYNPQNWGVHGFGIIVVVVGLTLIGMLTAGFVGRLLNRLYDLILRRMPVLSSIYSAVKQIFETVFSQKNNAFREVALIEYPRRDAWTLAFVTATTSGEVREHFDEDMVSVYVPTTPNPTSGFMLFLPRKDVQILEMTVDEGLKMILSTGLLTPEYPKPPSSGS